MNVNEIKQAVEDGKNVFWANPNYIVIKDSMGQWLIHSQFNDHYIGLTRRDGVTLNGHELRFYIEDEMPIETFMHLFDEEEVDYSIYDDYNGRCTDSELIVVDGYNFPDRAERIIEEFCNSNTKYDWNYGDGVYIDYDDNCAYVIGYDESDVIWGECECYGRRRFENGDMTFSDVLDMFVNNPTKALPSWLEPTNDWEERSCDFANGWYGRNDNPEEILEKLDNQDLDVVFQINSVNMFETRFCVWTSERS